MSINVHVSGNPVHINRGKMVTADLDHCKKEFEKRRLMRLEQVRQQSKNIAEGVRKKVKHEKKIQVKEIEEEGKQQLKSWQNRKLLELQTQYAEAIKELGVAHKAAQSIGDENKLLAEKERNNLEISNKRGKIAENMLHDSKQKEELEKILTNERKKIVREIENTRAHMVARAPKPKRPKGEISVTICSSDDESSTDNNYDLSVEEATEESSSCSCAIEKSAASNVSVEGAPKRKNYKSSRRTTQEQTPIIVPPLQLVSDDSPNAPIPTSTRLIPPSRKHVTPVISPRKSVAQEQYDTRISDRIKHRNLCSEPSGMSSPEPVPIPFVQSRTDIRDRILSRVCHEDCTCCCSHKKSKDKLLKDKETETMPLQKDFSIQTQQHRDTQTSTLKVDESVQIIDDLPSLPSVKLKSTSTDIQKRKSPTKRQEFVSSRKERRVSPVKSKKVPVNKEQVPTSKVQVYDHPNRFSYEKSMPSGSFVERIPIESVEYMTDTASEEERQEAIKRRDRDAQIRGRRALEKEKLQRDYEEMLKKLPLLQKKERICEIYNDKPEYHMSEERLKEKERQKQNNLENVYNKLFPNLKPAVVTLPKSSQTREDENSSVHSLNVAEWDVDYRAPHRFSSKEVQDILTEFIQKQSPRDRRSKLKELIKNLKIEKEELLKAFNSLPKTDTLDELINDLQSFSGSETKSKSKSVRKRSRKDDTDTSVDSSQEINTTKKTSRSSAGKSPRKKAKMKSKPNVIILQNTSTQTTPKIDKKLQDVDKKVQEIDKKIKEVMTNTCSKLHVPCDCNKENVDDKSDDLCHIFIKLHDADTPEILVKAKDKEKSYKPVLTKHTSTGTQISPVTQHHKTKSISKQSQTTSVEKSRTWKEQFSKNSISTTSTSYLSPPDFIQTKPREKNYYNLKKQPQQEELSSVYSSRYSQDVLEGELKAYVKKLLSLPKVAVDNLSVSTSNVETPSQSVIELETNQPKLDLKELVEEFKSKIGTITDGLRYSPDPVPPFNTSVSTVNNYPQATSSRKDLHKKSDEQLVDHYAKISDSVSKRIETLAKMIEKLRNEKLQMIQSCSKSCKNTHDFSTSYMDLPDFKSSNSSSKSLTSEEEEIFRKLMEIDKTVLNKGGSKSDAVDTNIDSNSKTKRSTSPNSTNQEFISRLQSLRKKETTSREKTSSREQPASRRHSGSKEQPVSREQSTSKEQQTSKEQSTSREQPTPREQLSISREKSSQLEEQPSFVPFLSDIPKLPKFEPQLDPNHKRPPPSKGLIAAKKFNGNISLIPHELSTIVEGDSQMSTKLPSPESSDMNINVPLLTIPEVQEVDVDASLSPEQKRKSSSSSKDKDDTSKSGLLSFLSLSVSDSISLGKAKKQYEDSLNQISLPHVSSSSSSDDIETIESMLRSIGMEWAIPTLHKTNEALALGSSSSSLDLSKKTNKSLSDTSLKNYLLQQLLDKVSSSTMLSGVSPGSFLEHTDVSGIPSTEKSRQRTSTPVNQTKSSSKSKVFTDSDLSSIKQDNSRTRRKS